MTDTVIAGSRRHFLITYDIADSKRLRNVAKWIENFAYRVQLSVFEAELDEKSLEKLVRGLNKIIDDMDDSVYIFPVCEDDWAKREEFGTNGEAEPLYGQACAVL